MSKEGGVVSVSAFVAVDEAVEATIEWSGTIDAEVDRAVCMCV
jgi:hypothetical protein